MSQKMYVNHLGVRVVAEDFALMASLLENPGQAGPELVPTPDVQLFMSPVLAKKLMNILAQSVAQYETLFGVIAVEPDLEKAKKLAASLPKGSVMEIGSEG